ncbi:tripeptidyl peptidase A [Rickenella mellea]|uniref:tripeptidyl-peptidase II n=1 Tax=Rickenella mellea TaxID=50990 RepID=A0A4Y7PTM9_9AGAM|nr:tripeptidyl peptidase A [Rickenella mellea]
MHIVKEFVLPPHGWTKGAPARSDDILELRIYLPQPKFSILEEHLYDTSDPNHERYGQHLTKKEVEELVTPAEESIRVVDGWLAAYGFNQSDLSRSPARDWVKVRAPVRVVEEMLNTTYHHWTHDESRRTSVAALSYSVPHIISDHIELIQPTTMFSGTKARKTVFKRSNQQFHDDIVGDLSRITLASGISVDASCNTTITVSCLKQLYNVTGYKPSSGRNEIGVTGYIGEYADVLDLQLFNANQRPDAKNSTFRFISVHGGSDPQNSSLTGAEANLDVQFAFGLTFPTSSTFYSTAGGPPFAPDLRVPLNSNEPYMEWLDFMLSHPNPPQTISTSYADDEQTVPETYARRVCKGFAQLGARGVSLIFSSGDGGVGDGDSSPTTQKCFSNGVRNVTRFIPGFPASCPYVTAVGGTASVPEVGASFSGGGFSEIFYRPQYQNEAVKKYLHGLPTDTYHGLFNSNGRAIPDVSSQSVNFEIVLKGEPSLISGTSASCPTFAGLVSLLNDVRLSHGRPPLGFLNPFLYSRGRSGFTDITVGNNPGCGTPGFNATEGWDPVTGLGTPNFGELTILALQR